MLPRFSEADEFFHKINTQFQIFNSTLYKNFKIKSIKIIFLSKQKK